MRNFVAFLPIVKLQSFDFDVLANFAMQQGLDRCFFDVTLHQTKQQKRTQNEEKDF
jgi:predicted DsbA family dithiol-disulfide isomerase